MMRVRTAVAMLALAAATNATAAAAFGTADSSVDRDDNADATATGPGRHAPLSSDIDGLVDLDALRVSVNQQKLEALQALREAQAEIHVQMNELRTLAALDLGDRDARGSDDRDSSSRRGSSRDNDPTGPSIDEHRPLNADGRVYVNNIAGSISIATWDRNEVSIGGSLGGSVEKLDISGDPSNLNVVVKLPKRSQNNADSVLRLRVPVGARVDLDSVSADVSIDGSRGPVKVNTVSGDVGLAIASSEVTVQTVSGDLKLRAPARLTKVNSVSGDVHMTGLQGKLSVETVSGNVELEGGKFSELRLKSISGDMRLNLTLDDTAQITGETLSGEIHMIVPSGLTGTALLKSFSGEAFCDGARQVDHQTGGRKREYVWGDGHGARVELSSFSGDIRVERH